MLDLGPTLILLGGLSIFSCPDEEGTRLGNIDCRGIMEALDEPMAFEEEGFVAAIEKLLANSGAFGS